MKKIGLYSFVVALTILFTGCISTTGGNERVAKLAGDSKFIVNKTTLDEVFAEIGNARSVFNKPNGITKYVYWGSEVTYLPEFAGGGSKRAVLALYFNSNNILVKKDFHKEKGYQDPDVKALANGIIQDNRIMESQSIQNTQKRVQNIMSGKTKEKQMQNMMKERSKMDQKVTVTSPIDSMNTSNSKVETVTDYLNTGKEITNTAVEAANSGKSLMNMLNFFTK